jgi:cytochrome b6-f complex iron-sulfur subunit
MKQEPEDKSKGIKSSRRSFVRKAWIAFGFIAAAEMVYFIISLLKPSRDINKSKQESSVMVIGSISDFTPGSVTPDRINKLYIVREADGGFLALSIVCPHLGCSVLWDEAKNQFDCPCHSSAFNIHGLVLNSPAPRPLDYFPVILEEGKVKVNINQKTKRKRFDSSQMSYAI